jgi:hypothetical protein
MAVFRSSCVCYGRGRMHSRRHGAAFPRATGSGTRSRARLPPRCSVNDPFRQMSRRARAPKCGYSAGVAKYKEFCSFRPPSAINSFEFNSNISGLKSNFPTHPNIEIISPQQGIKSSYQGSFRPDQRIPRWLPFSTPGLRSCSGAFSPHHESMGDQLHNRRHKVLGCGLISTIHEMSMRATNSRSSETDPIMEISGSHSASRRIPFRTSY